MLRKSATGKNVKKSLNLSAIYECYLNKGGASNSSLLGENGTGKVGSTGAVGQGLKASHSGGLGGVVRKSQTQNMKERGLSVEGTGTHNLNTSTSHLLRVEKEPWGLSKGAQHTNKYKFSHNEFEDTIYQKTLEDMYGGPNDINNKKIDSPYALTNNNVKGTKGIGNVLGNSNSVSHTHNTHSNHTKNVQNMHHSPIVQPQIFKYNMVNNYLTSDQRVHTASAKNRSSSLKRSELLTATKQKRVEEGNQGAPHNNRSNSQARNKSPNLMYLRRNDHSKSTNKFAVSSVNNCKLNRTTEILGNSTKLTSGDMLNTSYLGASASKPIPGFNVTNQSLLTKEDSTFDNSMVFSANNSYIHNISIGHPSVILKTMDNIDSSSGATAGCAQPAASINSGAVVGVGTNSSNTTMPALPIPAGVSGDKKKVIDKKREIHLNSIAHALTFQVKQKLMQIQSSSGEIHPLLGSSGGKKKPGTGGPSSGSGSGHWSDPNPRSAHEVYSECLGIIAREDPFFGSLLSDIRDNYEKLLNLGATSSCSGTSGLRMTSTHDLRTGSTSTEVEIEELRAQLCKSKGNVHNWERQGNALREENTQLRSDIREKCVHLEGLRGEISCLKEEIRECRREIAKKGADVKMNKLMEEIGVVYEENKRLNKAMFKQDEDLKRAKVKEQTLISLLTNTPGYPPANFSHGKSVSKSGVNKSMIMGYNVNPTNNELEEVVCIQPKRAEEESENELPSEMREGNHNRKKFNIPKLNLFNIKSNYKETTFVVKQVKNQDLLQTDSSIESTIQHNNHNVKNIPLNQQSKAKKPVIPPLDLSTIHKKRELQQHHKKK